VASGANSVVAGGERNTASGLRSAVLGGFSNVASGTNSATLAGNANTASATNSAVGGGTGNTAAGSASFVPGGDGANTRVQQMGAWAFGSFTAAGDAQAGERVLRRITTDATPLRLSSGGVDPVSSTNFNLGPNATVVARLLVVAQQTGGNAGTVGDSAAWEVTVLMRRLSGLATTAYVGGTLLTAAPGVASAAAGAALAPSLNAAGAAAWRLTLEADTTLGGLAVSGTGETNKTIRWVARVLSAEVTA
jgi:hypothetical protein